MPSNVVEATFRSKYEDGIEAGVENTRELMEQAFSAMGDAGATASAAMQTAFNSVVGSLDNYRKNLSKAADDSDSSFKRMSLGAAAVGIAIAEAMLHGAKAAGDFAFDLVKESSEVAVARINFEALTAAQGQNADMLLGKLKQATEGQIGQLTLLRNANKVLTGDLPLTGDQYVRLTENVMRLSKSSGTDAVAAQDALTTALLRGQSRGLGPAIGLHLAVKDAVAAMSEEMNTSAAAMPDHAKLQAYYNDLLAKTDAAVKKLPPSFLTLEEAINAAKTKWSDWLEDIGTSITRSGVFQGILVELTGGLDSATSSMDQQHRIALQVNDALLSMLRAIAQIVDFVSPLVFVLEYAWADIKAIGFAVAGFFNGVLDTILHVAQGIVYAWAYIRTAGNVGQDDLYKDLQGFTGKLDALQQKIHNGWDHSFDNAGDGAVKLALLSDKANELATQMEALRGKVLNGADGVHHMSDAAEQAAVDQKALNDQLKTYQDLMFNFTQATASTPQERAMNELVKTNMEILKLDKLTDDQRADLRQAAWDKYQADIAKQFEEEKAREQEQNKQRLAAQSSYNEQVLALQNELELASASDEQKASAKRLEEIAKVQKLVALTSDEGKKLLLLIEQEYDHEMDRIQAERLRKQQEAEKKSLQDALAAAAAIQHAVEGAMKGTIPQSIADQALGNLPQVIDTLKQKLAQLKSQPIFNDQQIAEIEKVQTALNALNKLNMSPFKQILQQLKDQMQQMGQQITQAWGQFWSDLASGQENAGKKFLGSLLQMAGQQLEMLAITQTAKAIASAADLDFAGAARHAAAAAALGALGGIISGLGSALGNSSSNSSAATTVPAASTSGGGTSPTPPTLSVGAPQQQASQQPVQQHIVTLQVQSNDSHIVKVVKNDIQSNGQLRVAVKSA